MTKGEKTVAGIAAAIAAFFTIKKVIAIECRIDADCPTGYRCVEGKCVPIVLAAGLVSGTVTDDDTGLPIDGIEITFNSLTYTTNIDGSFEFLEVDAGTYELVAIDPLERYGGETMSVTIEAGKVTTVGITMVSIPQVGGLDVTVTDSVTGVRLESIEVTIVELGIKKVTDAAGFIAFRNLPSGTYTLSLIDLLGKYEPGMY